MFRSKVKIEIYKREQTFLLKIAILIFWPAHM